MDVVGYVRTLAWGPAAETEPEPQEEAVRRWAEVRGHRLVAVVHDELRPGSDDLRRRLALARALGMLRDRSAKALVVARLDRLDQDLVMQERLLAEVRVYGGMLFSACAEEEDALEDEPGDPVRAMARRVLATAAAYERARRELWITHHVARTGVPRDRQRMAVAVIEAAARDGASVEEIAARLRLAGFTPGAGYLFGRPRLRRMLASLAHGLLTASRALT